MKYRTESQKHHRRQMRRMRRAWRCSSNGLSLKAWARQTAASDPLARTDIQRLCAGWLERKGVR